MPLLPKWPQPASGSTTQRLVGHLFAFILQSRRCASPEPDFRALLLVYFVCLSSTLQAKEEHLTQVYKQLVAEIAALKQVCVCACVRVCVCVCVCV